jgi:hypothetical protein
VKEFPIPPMRLLETPQIPMRLQAYVFCGCYEHGRVKCPPHDHPQRP